MYRIQYGVYSTIGRLGDGTSWAGDKITEPIIFLEAYASSCPWIGGILANRTGSPSSWGSIETDEIRGVSGRTQEKQAWHAGQPKTKRGRGLPLSLARTK